MPCLVTTESRQLDAYCLYIHKEAGCIYMDKSSRYQATYLVAKSYVCSMKHTTTTHR